MSTNIAPSKKKLDGIVPELSQIKEMVGNDWQAKQKQKKFDSSIILEAAQRSQMVFGEKSMESRNSGGLSGQSQTHNKTTNKLTVKGSESRKRLAQMQKFQSGYDRLNQATPSPPHNASHEDSIFEDPSTVVGAQNDGGKTQQKSRSTWKQQPSFINAKDSLIMVSGTQVRHDSQKSQASLDSFALNQPSKGHLPIKVSVEPTIKKDSDDNDKLYSTQKLGGPSSQDLNAIRQDKFASEQAKKKTGK